jgi:serine/threonine protein phosphatase PrpC
LELNRTQQSLSQPVGVFVVADGMGGHSGGEMASGAIVNLFAQKSVAELLPGQITQKDDYDQSEWLRETVEAANQEVLKLRKSVGTDMGSTMVAVVLEKNRAYIAHVGDSRVYLINEQGIKQLTIDHSLVERLIATQQITREEARVHPQRNVIYRTIGDKPKVEVDVQSLDLSVGDALLLCSDGLTGMVQDRAIFNIVQGTSSPQMACDELINAANAAGGEDNIAAVMIKIVST